MFEYVEAGRTGLGLLSEAIQLARDLEKDTQEDPDLGTLLSALRGRAKELAAEAPKEIIALRRTIDDAGLDQSLSIDDLITCTARYQWIVRNRLKDFRARFRAMEDNLLSLIDDVTALLLCSGRIEDVQEAFRSAHTRKQDVYKGSSTHQPLDAVLNDLMRLATDLESQAHNL